MTAQASEAEFWDLYGDWGKDSAGNPLPCTVETFLSTGQLGPSYAAPVERPGMPRQGQQRLVRSSAGNEITSTQVLFTTPSLAPAFTLHSRVDLGDGEPRAVIARSVRDVDGFPAHVRLDLE